MEISPYPFNILRLLSQDGFIERFHEFTREEKTYQEAYFRTESEHLRWFGKTRYANYDSFRKIKERKYKGNKVP